MNSDSRTESNPIVEPYCLLENRPLILGPFRGKYGIFLEAQFQAQLNGAIGRRNIAMHFALTWNCLEATFFFSSLFLFSCFAISSPLIDNSDKIPHRDYVTALGGGTSGRSPPRFLCMPRSWICLSVSYPFHTAKTASLANSSQPPHRLTEARPRCLPRSSRT